MSHLPATSPWDDGPTCQLDHMTNTLRCLEPKHEAAPCVATFEPPANLYQACSDLHKACAARRVELP